MMRKWLDFLSGPLEGKYWINDADWQQLSTVQSVLQPKPVTMAAANTIAPTTFLTILTGNVVIKTITPPITGLHMLAIQFAGVLGNDATGNILTAKVSIVGMIVLYIYNPATGKYIPVGDNV
jgi:hypothetical protein